MVTHLDAAVFIAPEPVSVARELVIAALTSTFEDTSTRLRLLAGRASADHVDHGPTVCACFNIGRNAILSAIAAGADTDGCHWQVDIGGHKLRFVPRRTGRAPQCNAPSESQLTRQRIAHRATCDGAGVLQPDGQTRHPRRRVGGCGLERRIAFCGRSASAYLRRRARARNGQPHRTHRCSRDAHLSRAILVDRRRCRCRARARGHRRCG